MMRKLVMPVCIAMTLLGAFIIARSAEQIQTGLAVGDAVPGYNPVHVAGPDKGTNACPV